MRLFFQRRARGYGLLAVLLSVAVCAAGCGAALPMPGSGSTSGGPVLRVLAFYDPSAEKPTGAVQSLLVANRSAIAELAPLWYEVQSDGSLRDKSSSHLKTWAQSEHIALMPLVVNAGGTSSFLLNAAARAKAVAALAAVVKANNYDGLNIDFEQLRNAARGPLVQFMSELHAKLRAMNKLLTIDIIPSGSRRAAQSGAYNDAALARNADEVVLMTYDAHDNGSAPGPIAPLSWVKKRVAVALAAGIPRKRLVLGIADYGYDWPVSPRGQGVEIGLKQVDALLASQKITPKRNAGGSPYFTYTKNGVTHVVWYEDSRAVLPKIEYARREGLAGLGLWMVGFETAHYWQAVRAAAGTGSGGTATPTSASKPVTTAAAASATPPGSGSVAASTQTGATARGGSPAATSSSDAAASSGAAAGPRTADVRSAPPAVG